ncbi:MAG: transcriptional repressor [Rhodobacteraceae bacterium]|uniref:Fur family transcriptional regulator n=1 Tax=Amaricoccus sp. B4 TaxID=3368557 RepID=UPI000DAD96A9|nr:transcriptional repressor [Paracoccaceae bacterium]
MTEAPSFDVFQPHDHRRCRKEALAAVLAECSARKLRLTPPRRCVLEALLEEHRAMTAYELLDRLREAGLGSQPPVVYRALDFLLANGFAHRIERLSAFVACTHGEGAHEAVFLVCRACRQVAEASLPALARNLEAEASEHAFRVERVAIEVEGLCARCAGAGA